jgi:hypothetical protein
MTRMNSSVNRPVSECLTRRCHRLWQLCAEAVRRAAVTNPPLPKRRARRRAILSNEPNVGRQGQGIRHRSQRVSVSRRKMSNKANLSRWGRPLRIGDFGLRIRCGLTNVKRTQFGPSAAPAGPVKAGRLESRKVPGGARGNRRDHKRTQFRNRQFQASAGKIRFLPDPVAPNEANWPRLSPGGGLSSAGIHTPDKSPIPPPQRPTRPARSKLSCRPSSGTTP